MRFSRRQTAEYIAEQAAALAALARKAKLRDLAYMLEVTEFEAANGHSAIKGKPRNNGARAGKAVVEHPPMA